jgi:hypothetical protein
MSSRALPPADPSALPPATAVPQPRVYGRPAAPVEDDEAPQQQRQAPPPRGPMPPHGPLNPQAPLPPQDGPALDYRSGQPVGRAAPPQGGMPPSASPAAPGWPPAAAPEGGERGRFSDFSPLPDASGGQGPRGFAAAPPPTGSPMAPPGSPMAPPGSPVGFGGPPGQRPMSPPTRPQQGFQGTAGMRPVSTPPQQSFPSSGAGSGGWNEPDNDRFTAFRPDQPTDPPRPDAAEQPAPKERNGRVLALVLVAAVLLVAIPLGVVYWFTRPDSSAFNPAVGECVKQSGETAVTAGCGEAGAFIVVSKVADQKDCENKQEWVVVPNADAASRVLCLRAQGAAAPGGTPSPGPS